MNNIGELAQIHDFNIVAIIGEIATLVLCILKYKYNGVKSLKIIFYSMVIVETLLMCFMDYGTFQIAVAYLLSIVLLPELIIRISKYPNVWANILKYAFAFMFIGGMSLYFYCHYIEVAQAINGLSKENSLSWAKNALWFHKVFYIVISSVIDVGWMFYGRGNSDVFFRLPEAQYPWAVFGFWLLHIIAFLTAVSAMLIRFGDNLLRWVRTKIQVSCVDLIFGVNADSLAFSRKIANTGDNMLVYVDSIVSEDYKASIKNLGGIIYSDAFRCKCSKRDCLVPEKNPYREE